MHLGPTETAAAITAISAVVVKALEIIAARLAKPDGSEEEALESDADMLTEIEAELLERVHDLEAERKRLVARIEALEKGRRPRKEE